MKTSVNIPIKGIISSQCELRVNNRQTRDRSDIKEVIDIVTACKRSLFRDVFFIHLYCRKTRQQKEKITTKRTNVLKKLDAKNTIKPKGETKMTNIAKTIRILAESKINCNNLILLDFILERFSINAKRKGTTIILIVEKIMLYVV
jgi:hypothetical protein